MKTLLTIFVLVLFCACEARAADAPNALFFGFGGQESCASWTSNAAKDSEAAVWIWGYWSGLNVADRDHLVGSNTDGPGIIGEVRLQCDAHPSELLFYAVDEVYARMASGELP